MSHTVLLAPMAWEISVREPIRAPPGTVWDVLTAFEAYGEWNPTLTSVTGEPELGERLRVTVSLPSGLGLPFVATVTVLDPERELRWATGLPSDGALDAEHAVVLEPDDDGVVVDQRARFEGALAEPVLGRLSAQVRAGLEAMNEALKERAEARARG